VREANGTGGELILNCSFQSWG